jgi:hypothetical protein
LRHRRRISSQNQTRKNNASRPSDIPKVKSGTFLKIVKYIALCILITGAVYLIGGPAWPLISAGFSSYMSSETKRAKKAEPIPIPVEEKPIRQEEPQLFPVKRKVQVEVLNGCGENGVAKVVTDQLKLDDFDVINSGNYVQKGKTNFNQPVSRIIDQLGTGGNKSSAREIARMIGIDYDQIESLQNAAPVADITIIIGKDYKDLKIFKHD